jgi:exodeoxyribonuclease-1
MTLDIYKTLGIEKIKERADIIHNSKEFCKNVGEALGETAREKKEKSNDKKKELVENLLYGGSWPTKPDEEKMTAFHATDDWNERNKIASSFSDSRFRFLGKRLVYQNQSDALSKKEYNEIHTDIAKKILDINEDRFQTIPMSEQLCDNMRAEKNIPKEKLDYINEIDEWLHQQRKIYERAV